MGIDYSSSGYNTIDLSEHQLAWFSFTSLPDECEDFPSQAGEGYHCFVYEDDDSADIIDLTLNQGGFANYATTIYSAGIGPVLESMVPYAPNSDTSDDEKANLAVITFTDDGKIDMENTFYDSFSVSKTDIEALKKE